MINDQWAMIFRKSVNNSEVPAEWKTATVIPIFKKGKKSAAGNYRPVSLKSVSCKVLESILKDDIMDHLSRNQLIKKSHEGEVLRHQPSRIPGQNYRGNGQRNGNRCHLPGFCPGLRQSAHGTIAEEGSVRRRFHTSTLRYVKKSS